MDIHEYTVIVWIYNGYIEQTYETENATTDLTKYQRTNKIREYRRRKSSDFNNKGDIQLELTAFLETCEERGMKILESGNSIRKITKNHYIAMSRSQDKFYNVRKLSNSNVWTCECSDFIYRLFKKDDKRYKHIISCELLQNTVEEEQKVKKIERAKICSKCLSTKIIKIDFSRLER